ncbi:unnamed protein product, partial [Rotaria socialis]
MIIMNVLFRHKLRLAITTRKREKWVNNNQLLLLFNFIFKTSESQ